MNELNMSQIDSCENGENTATNAEQTKRMANQKQVAPQKQAAKSKPQTQTFTRQLAESEKSSSVSIISKSDMEDSDHSL